MLLLLLLLLLLHLHERFSRVGRRRVLRIAVVVRRWWLGESSGRPGTEQYKKPDTGLEGYKGVKSSRQQDQTKTRQDKTKTDRRQACNSNTLDLVVSVQ